MMTDGFPYKDIPERINISMAHHYCGQQMQELFERSPLPIRPITMHLLSAPGKGVRSSLLFCAAMDREGFVPKEAIAAATAVEIFHLATLVHDDVIDEADTRRGIQSVQNKFGKKEAILCGDYLFGLAFVAIAEIYEPYGDCVKTFAKTVSKICLGELRQHRNNFNRDIHLYDYLRTIYGKTAALFYLSGYGGGLLGGASPKELRSLGEFGTYFGMVFQIVDDCKDYILKDKEALKPTLSDIGCGVVNLPLLMAYLKEPTLRKAPFTLELIQDVQRLDGVGDALNIARKYEKKGKRLLDGLENKEQSLKLEALMTQVFQPLKVRK